MVRASRTINEIPSPAYHARGSGQVQLAPRLWEDSVGPTALGGLVLHNDLVLCLKRWRLIILPIREIYPRHRPFMGFSKVRPRGQGGQHLSWL